MTDAKLRLFTRVIKRKMEEYDKTVDEILVDYCNLTEAEKATIIANIS